MRPAVVHVLPVAVEIGSGAQRDKRAGQMSLFGTFDEAGGEAPAGASISDDAQEGTQIGKRYINEAGDLEVLCTKPGDGSLAAGGATLTIKGAKPLPSSD